MTSNSPVDPTTSSSTPLSALFLHTHNVARNLKPSPDGELANALHETLHFALDGEEEDWGIRQNQTSVAAGCGGEETKASQSESTNPSNEIGFITLKNSSGQEYQLPTARPGFFLSSNPSRPYISYSWSPKNKILSLPNPTLISNPTQLDPCSPEKRNDFDVTAKLFFLGEPGDNGFDPGFIDQALNRLTLTTGLITVDTLILAFPALKLDSNWGESKGERNSPCGGESEGDDRGKEEEPLSQEELNRLNRDIQHVRRLWEAVSPNPQCLSLGLSDFSLPSLQALFSSFSPPPPPHNSTTSNSSLSENIKSSESSSNSHSTSTVPVVAPALEVESTSSAFTTPSQTRRPRVVTINVKEDPCSFDRELSSWCEEEGMGVLAHADRKDILPEHTLSSLLSEFISDLPHPIPTDKTLRARWVLKYSVLIEQRGVLADRGYIVYADTE